MNLRRVTLPAEVVLLSIFALTACGNDTGPLEPTDPPEGFQIEIRYLAGTEPTEEQRRYFDEAVERWEQVIVGDLEAVRVNQPTPFTCQKLSAPAMDEEIDDLVVFVEFGPLDGPWQGIGSDDGYAIGWGGPCVLRDNYLPAVSSITIDIADIDWLATWLAVHELGHALGFGEVWHELGLLSDPSDPIHGAPGSIEPIADATISSYSVDQNFGLPVGSALSENLVVGQNLGMWTDAPDDEQLRFLLQFELPAEITVPPSRATLVLHASDWNFELENAVLFWQNLSAWSENGVTWNNRPVTASTGYGGTWDATMETYSHNVTREVGEWITDGNFGLTFYGWLPAAPDPGYSFGFYTRDAVDPSVRPQLRVLPDTRFVGAAALAAFEEVGGGGYEGGKVPVDNNYRGPTELGGSSDGHWRSVVFSSEIMSPSGSATDALSLVTIASMEDMGYEVDRSVADPFTPRLGLSQVTPVSDVRPIDGTGAGPLYRVGDGGYLSVIRR